MKKRFRLSEGSGKILIALALVSLLALPVFCLFPHHFALAATRQNARMQGQVLKLRASAICTAMGAVNPTISEPQFVVQSFRAQASRGQRRLWMVDCVAGSHRYSMIFNDLTGNIQSMFSDGLTVTTPAAALRNAAVISPSEAVEGSVRRLKDLQMVPKGTRIALAERPLSDKAGTIWRIVWKVRRPESAAPYEVRMVLDGADATPMVVVNCHELEKFARN